MMTPLPAEAGPKVAAILSVIETCRRLKLSARDYLLGVLPGLANVRVSHLSAFTLPPGPLGVSRKAQSIFVKDVFAPTLTDDESPATADHRLSTRGKSILTGCIRFGYD